MDKINIPNILTVVRLVVPPFFFSFLLAYLLPYNFFWLNFLLALFFLALAVTDFFDGYLARLYRQETLFGRVADPLADKFLFYSTLVALVASQKLFFYWAIILIGREFLVMGLRIIALENGFAVPVSYAAKFKTAVQVIWLWWVICNPYTNDGYCAAWYWNGGEFFLGALTIFLSLLTAYWYYRDFMVNMRGTKV